MAKFSFLYLLTSLVAVTLAVPGTVYRADRRKPSDIKAAGGFKGYGTNKDITVIEHVTKQYAKGHRGPQDPWISTSESPEIGSLPTVTKPAWVYTIDTSGIDFVDAEKEFKDAGKDYPHKTEKEWSSNGVIPVSAIKSFYYLKKDLSKGTVFTWESYEKAEKAKEDKKKAGTSTSTEPEKEGTGSTSTDPKKEGTGSTSTDPKKEGTGSTSTDPKKEGTGSTSPTKGKKKGSRAVKKAGTPGAAAFQA